MTSIQPAAPNNASQPATPQEGTDQATAATGSAFLALLAMLAPLDPKVPTASLGHTDLLSSQAAKDAAKGLHDKDGKDDDRRKGVRLPPGTGMLLPVPVLIGSLAPTKQPNATADSRTPIARRMSATDADAISSAEATRAGLTQGQAGAAGQTKPSFTVSPPPTPDVATNDQGKLPSALSVASIAKSVVPPPRLPAQPGVIPLGASSRTRKGDQLSSAIGLPAFAPTKASAPAPTVTTSPPSTAPMPPGMATTAQQIVAQAQLVRMGQTTEMRMRLRPPELGDVHVTLRRDGEGKMSVHLIPSTAEGEAALRTNLHHLRAALDQHSSSQGADVSLGQHDSSKHQQHAHQEHAREGQWDDTMLTGTPARPTTRTAARTTTISRTGNGTVDYDA